MRGRRPQPGAVDHPPPPRRRPPRPDRPEHAHRTIDAIARTWGFTSPAHFARRFRQAYGSTPRTWRAASAPNTGD
ncbi:AraC family transcriptional regulator [Nonomuraea thailandensis]